MSRRHENHHFIPAFLLRPWERGDDSRLTTLAWRNGAIRIGRNRAKAVAKLAQLYTLHELPSDRRNIIEARVLQKIDTDGAAVHSVFLAPGHPTLSAGDAVAWTRLVLSLVLRSPWMIEKYIEDAPRVLLETIKKSAAAGEDPEDTFLELQSRNPDLARSMTLQGRARLLPRGQSHAAMLGATWTVVDVSSSPFDLVIADQPVLRTGGFNEDYLFALPIAPTKLFLMHPEHSTWPGRLGALPTRELVMRVNRESATQAHTYLFATSGAQARLAEAYLRVPQARQAAPSADRPKVN